MSNSTPNLTSHLRASLALLALSLLIALGAPACERGSPGKTPVASTVSGATGSSWFTDIASASGLSFMHDAGACGLMRMPEILGPGCALLDYDRDGDLDALLINGDHTYCPDRAGTPHPGHRLFRQESNGNFIDVTAQSGLTSAGYGMGVAVGDIDNDGYPDLLITCVGPDRLYRNLGDGRFADITEAANVHEPGWSTSAAFVDYDRDGFLDLFITRYLDEGVTQKCFDSAGRLDYCSPATHPPMHSVLLHNERDGTFADVSEMSGIASARAHGLGVTCLDVNDDGWPDVYVANDGDANHLWMNQRDGTFVESGVKQGAAYNMHGRAQAGMGVLAADFDGDGLDELFVTNLRNESNTLFRPASPGVFGDASGPARLTASSMRFTGFGTAAFDIEHDGDLDLAVINGRVARGPLEQGVTLAAPWRDYAESNLLYFNDGDGAFDLADARGEGFCQPPQVGRGLAIGDIDRDGDVDMLVSCDNGAARLIRNDAPSQGAWLQVRAIDPALRRDAIGARVVVSAGGRNLHRSVISAFSYLSSSEPIAHFGLGRLERVDRIVVRWPDGSREEFTCDGVNRAITLERGKGAPVP